MCCNRVFAASGNVSIPPGGNAPLGGIGMRKSPARTRGFFRPWPFWRTSGGMAGHFGRTRCRRRSWMLR